MLVSLGTVQRQALYVETDVNGYGWGKQSRQEAGSLEQVRRERVRSQVKKKSLPPPRLPPGRTG